MTHSLNFNNLKKQYMTVTLPDEKQTVLMIGTPTKNLMGEISNFLSILMADNNDNDTDLMNDMYALCAKIMSRNKTGYKVTTAMLSKCLDYEDMAVFLYSYTNFIESIGNQKN